MSEHASFRARIVFRKGDAVRYISHLDLLRAWERTLRRAGMPLAYSHGFTPHPKIAIAMPLPVGCTGEHEEMDILTTEAISPAEMRARLEPALPAGIEVVSVIPVPLKAPSRPSLIRQAHYRVILDGTSSEQIARQADELMKQGSIPVAFRRSRYDLRPLIASLAVRDAGETTILDMALLRDARGRIGRPDVVLEALGLSDRARSIHRTQIVFEKEG